MAYIRWKGESGDVLAARMKREGRLTGKRALRHMRRVSKATLETAVAWSPVDWKGARPSDPPGHELEKSHRIEEEYGDNRRLEARIVVGGMVGDVNVDKYAMWVHSGMGWHQRGRATIAKGPEAGPGWLDRAMKHHEEDMDILLDEVMDALF